MFVIRNSGFEHAARARSGAARTRRKRRARYRRVHMWTSIRLYADTLQDRREAAQAAVESAQCKETRGLEPLFAKPDFFALRTNPQLRTCTQRTRAGAATTRRGATRNAAGAGETPPDGAKKFFRGTARTHRFRLDLRKTAQLCADADDHASRQNPFDAHRFTSKKRSGSASIWFASLASTLRFSNRLDVVDERRNPLPRCAATAHRFMSRSGRDNLSRSTARISPGSGATTSAPHAAPIALADATTDAESDERCATGSRRTGTVWGAGAMRKTRRHCRCVAKSVCCGARGSATDSRGRGNRGDSTIVDQCSSLSISSE